MPNINSRLSAVITSARKLHGLTQADLANELDMKRSSYKNKEMAGRFTKEELTIIAKPLKMKASELHKLLSEEVALRPEQTMEAMANMILAQAGVQAVILDSQAEILSHLSGRKKEDIFRGFMEKINRKGVSNLSVIEQLLSEL